MTATFLFSNKLSLPWAEPCWIKEPSDPQWRNDNKICQDKCNWLVRQTTTIFVGFHHITYKTLGLVMKLPCQWDENLELVIWKRNVWSWNGTTQKEHIRLVNIRCIPVTNCFAEPRNLMVASAYCLYKTSGLFICMWKTGPHVWRPSKINTIKLDIPDILNNYFFSRPLINCIWWPTSLMNFWHHHLG